MLLLHEKFFYANVTFFLLYSKFILPINILLGDHLFGGHLLHIQILNIYVGIFLHKEQFNTTYVALCNKI